MKTKQILITLLCISLFGCTNQKSNKSNDLLPKDATIVSVPDASIKPDTNTYSLGKVVSEYGSPFYGVQNGYSKDIYLGRLSVGAKVLLMDTQISKNQFDIPIVKVKAIDDDHYGKGNVGQIGWVTLKDTNFINIYNPKTNVLELIVQSEAEQVDEHNEEPAAIVTNPAEQDVAPRTE